MGIRLLPLLLAALLAGCGDEPPRATLPDVKTGGPEPATARGRIADTCPDLSGSYVSETLQGETLQLTQHGCTTLTMHATLPGIFDHTYTYRLDGRTRTDRHYLVATESFVAWFDGAALLFVGRGAGYTSHERWQLESPDRLREDDYAVRDSGEKYNVMKAYYRRARP